MNKQERQNMDNRAEQQAIEKLRALLKSEGIEFTNKQEALKSISGTVLPTRLTKIYLKELERINGRL